MPTLGVWKFASCDGCQLSLLDCEDELLLLAEQVQIRERVAFGQCLRERALAGAGVAEDEVFHGVGSGMRRIRGVLASRGTLRGLFDGCRGIRRCGLGMQGEDMPAAGLQPIPEFRHAPMRRALALQVGIDVDMVAVALPGMVLHDAASRVHGREIAFELCRVERRQTGGQQAGKQGGSDAVERHRAPRRRMAWRRGHPC